MNVPVWTEELRGELGRNQECTNDTPSLGDHVHFLTTHDILWYGYTFLSSVGLTVRI